MELDNIDFQILRLLSENSRIQWKDLGEQIHMTGKTKRYNSSRWGIMNISLILRRRKNHTGS